MKSPCNLSKNDNPINESQEKTQSCRHQCDYSLFSVTHASGVSASMSFITCVRRHAGPVFDPTACHIAFRSGGASPPGVSHDAAAGEKLHAVDIAAEVRRRAGLCGELQRARWRRPDVPGQFHRMKAKSSPGSGNN